MQILRLTTPKLHPKEQRSLFGDPGTEKRLGAPFAQDDRQMYVAYFRLGTLAAGEGRVARAV